MVLQVLDVVNSAHEAFYGDCPNTAFTIDHHDTFIPVFVKLWGTINTDSSLAAQCVGIPAEWQLEGGLTCCNAPPRRVHAPADTTPARGPGFNTRHTLSTSRGACIVVGLEQECSLSPDLPRMRVRAVILCEASPTVRSYLAWSFLHGQASPISCEGALVTYLLMCRTEWTSMVGSTRNTVAGLGVPRDPWQILSLTEVSRRSLSQVESINTGVR
uniref:Uncharacterized protein n=1 Tax=Timema genevievae TaxID=629358 RepID=A0A7R9PGY7_TIMGE|nr:unnamed protein product [Timema genevievae]